MFLLTPSGHCLSLPWVHLYFCWEDLCESQSSSLPIVCVLAGFANLLSCGSVALPAHLPGLRKRLLIGALSFPSFRRLPFRKIRHLNYVCSCSLDISWHNCGCVQKNYIGGINATLWPGGWGGLLKCCYPHQNCYHDAWWKQGAQLIGSDAVTEIESFDMVIIRGWDN